MKSRRFYQFTLIELLVVIAIIAVLAALLLPSLSHAREMGKSIACLGNAKQLAMAENLYLGDYGVFSASLVYNESGSGGWGYGHFLAPYISSSSRAFHCPSDTANAYSKKSYALNDMNYKDAVVAGYSKPAPSSGIAKGINPKDVKKPSQTFMFTEWFAGSLIEEPAYSDSNTPAGVSSSQERLNFRYHSSAKGNVSFFDGHSAAVKYQDVKLIWSSVWNWWDYRWDDK